MKLLAICAALLLGACGKRAGEQPIGKRIEIKVPLGLPPLKIPPDNPPTVETISLGKKLYFDPRLSGDNSVSCATCHSPERGFGDGRKTAMGMNKQVGKRNAPTIFNAAYGSRQFWDGRAASLEEQAAGPIANPIEMSLPHEDCAAKLNADPEYRRLFTEAFGDGRIRMIHVQKAIAAYERTLISGNSLFDRYQYGGDKSALSESAVRGLALFKTNCTACHLMGEKWALFTDGQFHNIGAGLSSEGELTDLGRYGESKTEGDRGAFKTPSLRNVALSGPYMHDGGLKSLREAVDFYAGGGSSNPHLDKEIKPLTLTGLERADLVAFLESLTGEVAKWQ